MAIGIIRNHGGGSSETKTSWIGSTEEWTNGTTVTGISYNTNKTTESVDPIKLGRGCKINYTISTYSPSSGGGGIYIYFHPTGGNLVALYSTVPTTFSGTYSGIIDLSSFVGQSGTFNVLVQNNTQGSGQFTITRFDVSNVPEHDFSNGAIVLEGELNPKYTLQGGTDLRLSAGGYIVLVRDASGNGGRISGIDWTKIATLTVDAQNVGGTNTYPIFQIDSYSQVHNLSTSTTRFQGTVNASGTKDVHDLILTRNNNGSTAIFNVTVTPYPEFSDNEIIKNGILNPKYTIPGGTFAPDNLYVPYGGVSYAGVLLDEIDLTDYTGFNIEYQNSHATYRLYVGCNDSSGVWTSTSTTNRTTSDARNSLTSLTGLNSLRFYTYGDSNQYSRIYNLSLY